jgi:hypothetical protein
MRLILCGVLLWMGAFIGGCASAPRDAQLIRNTGELKSVQSYYGDRLEKLRPGMSVEEFKGIFPEAYPSGQNGDMTEYEVSREAKYVSQSDIMRQNIIWGFGSPTARVSHQAMWFYFQQGKFVSWGNSKGWPKTAESQVK